MDTVQTVDAGRRSMYDPDELEEEQREREIRNKVGPARAPADLQGAGAAGCQYPSLPTPP